jgi:hypothetical protein
MFDLQITQEDNAEGIWTDTEAHLFHSCHLLANVNWGELALSTGKTAKQCLKRHKRLIALSEQDGSHAAHKLQQQRQQQQQQSTTVTSVSHPTDLNAWQSSLR